jgi:16S rRNA (guanine966-N2)-methyltransferase
MHIVGGEFRGHPLFFTSNPKVRPMMQVVREGIFNIIQSEILETRVLDLFCGSGGVGLEALSRGADFCDFVDLDPSYTKKNIKKLGLEDYARTYKLDVFKALKLLKDEGQLYDFIFVGAPYEYPKIDEVMHKIDELALLAPYGFLMIEHRSNKDFPDDYNTFEKIKTYTYGQTYISRFRIKDS